MSAESQKQPKEETDIFILLNKSKDFANKTGFLLYRLFRFVRKNLYTIIALIVIGAVLGYAGDVKRAKAYKNDIIVTANFGSTDFLYNKVETMDFTEGPITKIKIAPITDLYAFIKERYNNLEFAKYMSDNSIKFEKYQPHQNVENFHRYHLITIFSKEKDRNGSVLNKFFDLFNNDKYFLERQKLEKIILENQIKEYEESINNINEILTRVGSGEEEDSNVSINSYPDLFQLINVKKSLIDDLQKFKIVQLEQGEVIYATSTITNIKYRKMWLVAAVPILFVLLFILWVGARKSYKRYKLMAGE